MSFILFYYINIFKLLPLDALNDRIFRFDFGPENNKTCTLSMDHIDLGKMRQSVSEILTLTRYFVLLIGDFIPLVELILNLYLTMCELIDIVLLTSDEESNCTLLETLVSEMNDLYIKYSKKRT